MRTIDEVYRLLEHESINSNILIEQYHLMTSSPELHPLLHRIVDVPIPTAQTQEIKLPNQKGLKDTTGTVSSNEAEQDKSTVGYENLPPSSQFLQAVMD